MPFNAPESLTADEVYAVSAYVLYLNDIIPEDAVLDSKSLPKVRMPNRDGFLTEDPRPDVRSKP
jgi:cytochrome c